MATGGTRSTGTTGRPRGRSGPRPVGQRRLYRYVDQQAVTVVADELLDDVFGNLFLNAVEHGGDDVTIDVTTTVADDRDCRSRTTETGVRQ